MRLLPAVWVVNLSHMAEYEAPAVPATGALATRTDDAVRYSFSGAEENMM